MAAPFKVPPTATAAATDWLRSHAWPIRIVPMTADHAEQWDQFVAPVVIRIELERLFGVRPTAPPRADAYWSYTWSTAHRLVSLGASLPIRSSGRVAFAQPQVWTVESHTPEGPRPVGMMLGISHYPFPEPRDGHEPIRWEGRKAKCLFAWLVTAAPADVLESWSVPSNVHLGRVLVDTIIQGSLAAFHFGHVLLHADPNGGADLMNFYSKCGMDRLDEFVFEHVTSQRPNDGRYFMFRPSTAGAFASTLSPLRHSSLGGVPLRSEALSLVL